MEGADYRLVRSVQNLDHTANGTAAARTPLHTYDYLVAVHGGFQGKPGHEDVLPTLVRRDEALPLWGNRNAARDQVDFLGHGKALAFYTV